MDYTFKDGAIVLTGKAYEKAIYDTATSFSSVAFDGLGGVSKYYVYNDDDYSGPDGICTLIMLDGKKLDTYDDKTVTMIGRTQTINLTDGDTKVVIRMAVNKEINGVFEEITIKSPAKDVELAIVYGDGASKIDGYPYGTTHKAEKFAMSCTIPGQMLSENDMFWAKTTMENELTVKVFYSYGKALEDSESVLTDFDKYMKAAFDEIAEIKIPAAASTEYLKAFYLSCYFCVYVNFKEIGDFGGFGAGCNYLNIVRTYFRDSYWTVLPMYRDHPELVRREITTLARGIVDGSCPSAVKYDYSSHWGDHYDSPSFFINMIHDYIASTGDKTVLTATANGKTVYALALEVMNRFSKYADETGLIYKEGPYNMRDWADEVDRNGYVTYNEALYCHALFSLGEICTVMGDTALSEKYLAESERVKKAINEILWDEEKGYYINYKYGDFVEDNLSVDTITAVIYNICTKEQGRRILENMKAILETRNNHDQKAGDFGVMSVYPFYKGLNLARNKSAQEYFYHNGGNWPYLSAMYAYALKQYGMEYEYALTSWFEYNIKRGNYTPIEYFSPCRPDGSLLQAWSGDGAFVLDDTEGFFERSIL